MIVRFARLTPVIDDVVQQSESITILEPVAERHGSWEWIAHSDVKSPYEKLNRFVILALTGSGSWYELEVWAGADNNERFARQLITSVRIEEKQIEDSDFLKEIRERLSTAVKRAEALKSDDLTEVYLRSLPSR